jgi:6-pyruvoyltetrahydropterin/6-carboxytetrahydropterin synthase
MNPHSISITKIFTFDTAHALENYPGKCKNIHGHTYILHVTVTGHVINVPNDPYEGMIVDFGDLKNWVRTQVIEDFDHTLVLDKKGEFIKSSLIEKNSKVLGVDYVPTCENMLIDICNRLRDSMMPGLSLKRLLLYETPTSYAEWNSE